MTHSRRSTIARAGLPVVAALACLLATTACSSGDGARNVTSAVSTVTETASVSAPATSDPSATAPAGDSASTPVADTGQALPTAAQVVVRSPSDFVDGSNYSFATPSRQIQCRVVEGNFICQTEGHPHTVATASLCNFYAGDEQGRAVRFGWFSSGPAPCATIIQGDGFISPHVLEYGQRVTFPPTSGRTITCGADTNGLTCTQVGGSGARGFFLSTDSFTTL